MIRVLCAHRHGRAPGELRRRPEGAQASRRICSCEAPADALPLALLSSMKRGLDEEEATGSDMVAGERARPRLFEAVATN